MSESSREAVICFGQQPCGFFPRRFLYAKIATARRLREEIGGRIVFFYHDSDHDPRETQTILRHRQSGDQARLNFTFENKVQRKYSPLYAKRVVDGWAASMGRQLPQYVDEAAQRAFAAGRGATVGEFCLSVYRAMGLLEGVEVMRSGDPGVREKACAVEDFYVDVCWEGELVRARRGADGGLRLHCGGPKWIDLPPAKVRPAAISPTRDTRMRWMQSVVRCTHYIAGAGELAYLNQAETPEVTFVPRDAIECSGEAYVEVP